MILYRTHYIYVGANGRAGGGRRRASQRSVWGCGGMLVNLACSIHSHVCLGISCTFGVSMGITILRDFADPTDPQNEPQVASLHYCVTK